MKKTTLLASFPFHTLLLSIYPIIYLYSQNFVFIPAGQTIRATLISAGFALVILAAYRLVLKEWQKAGLLTSLLMVLFYSFGHTANLLGKAWPAWLGASLNMATLAWTWLLVFLVSSFFVLRAQLNLNVTRFLNVAALVLTLMPFITVILPAIALRANSERELAQLGQLRGEIAEESTALSGQPTTNEYPDIYYIILDGYERADKLKEFYEYDNSGFIDALRQRGFYIGEHSRSNYLNTMYSLNTSLNMLYIHDFPKNTLRKSRYNLQTNHVNDFLHRLGYQVVVFDSGTGDTNNQDFDIFVTGEEKNETDQGGLNSFEMLLIRTTLGLEFFYYRDAANNGFVDAVNAELEERRDRITYTFEHLPDYATSEGPHFMFAHIYAPHIPFLYGPGESKMTYNEDINFYWYQPAPENYVEYYRYQVDHLNKAVLPVIDAIIRNAKKQTVIILQSDHGDDKYLNWNERDARGVDVRSSILNAIYFSDGDYTALYPAITPVNTFRVVFNHWFHTSYPLLPDKVYTHEHPLATRPNEIPVFEDACPKFGICPPERAAP